MTHSFIDRRTALLGAGAGLLAAAAPAWAALPAPAKAADGLLLNDLAQRCFAFFWETTPAASGLTPDRWPSPGPCSVASVGFALSAYVIGVQQGWVTRDQAVQRTLNTLRFFWRAPQGPGRNGVTGHKGFFYHFLDQRTGHRFGNSELSTVDTALFLLGALHAACAFDGNTPAEREVRDLAHRLYARVDWRWSTGGGRGVRMSWVPEQGFANAYWHGYDEAMFVYLLALGSPSFPLGADAWAEWLSTYETKAHWGEAYGQTYLQFGPQFGHQYAQCWLDLRGLHDAYCRSKQTTQPGFDYFENSRRATLAQQAYAQANPNGWRDYSASIWGLTACDGPGNFRHTDRDGRMRRFHGYTARGVGRDEWSVDDGTIAPTAAAASLPFAPDAVMTALQAMRERYGEHVYRRYGYVDAFNPSVPEGAPVQAGRVVPGLGWFDDDYIGIDQGPILLMWANHGHDSVWRDLRTAPWFLKALRLAGFVGGRLG